MGVSQLHVKADKEAHAFKVTGRCYATSYTPTDRKIPHCVRTAGNRYTMPHPKARSWNLGSCGAQVGEHRGLYEVSTVLGFKQALHERAIAYAY